MSETNQHWSDRFRRKFVHNPVLPPADTRTPEARRDASLQAEDQRYMREQADIDREYRTRIYNSDMKHMDKRAEIERR